jgi:hypothetical protein
MTGFSQILVSLVDSIDIFDSDIQLNVISPFVYLVSFCFKFIFSVIARYSMVVRSRFFVLRICVTLLNLISFLAILRVTASYFVFCR